MVSRSFLASELGGGVRELVVVGGGHCIRSKADKTNIYALSKTSFLQLFAFIYAEKKSINIENCVSR